MSDPRSARRSHETQAPDPDLAAAGGVRHQPRHDDRQRRAADARSRAARVQLAAAVGRGRVQPAVRRIGAGRRQPLGPVRAQGDAARGPVGLRPGEPGRRADRQLRPADRRARGDGRGCGDGVPVDAVADLTTCSPSDASARSRSACGARSPARRSRSGRSSAAGCSSSSTGAASSSR